MNIDIQRKWKNIITRQNVVWYRYSQPQRVQVDIDEFVDAPLLLEVSLTNGSVVRFEGEAAQAVIEELETL